MVRIHVLHHHHAIRSRGATLPSVPLIHEAAAGPGDPVPTGEPRGRHVDHFTRSVGPHDGWQIRVPPASFGVVHDVVVWQPEERGGGEGLRTG